MPKKSESLHENWKPSLSRQEHTQLQRYTVPVYCTVCLAFVCNCRVKKSDVASAPTVTGSVFMSRFKLFLGQFRFESWNFLNTGRCKYSVHGPIFLNYQTLLKFWSLGRLIRIFCNWPLERRMNPRKKTCTVCLRTCIAMIKTISPPFMRNFKVG